MGETMTDDTPVTALDIAQADSLYRGFPDFSEWGELSTGDLELWDRIASSFTEKRKSATPDALKTALEVAIRAAALDTGAIEGLYSVDRGFTMTVAVQGLSWQQMIEERGANIRDLFEAQLEAYELVLDAATRSRPFTEVWIRELHQILCAPQKTYRVLTEVGWQEQELPKGVYKTRPNHVRLADDTLHAYAPVDRVPSEMHRFLEQLRTPQFESAHPALQASYCHYAFVVIHPFADGNGRVARALASTFFYRALSIPLVVFAHQRLAYLDALQKSDLGDPGGLISFFSSRGVETMQLVMSNMLADELPSPETVAARIGRLLYPQKGISHHLLDTLSNQLLAETGSRLKAQFDYLNLPEELSLVVNRAEDNRGPLPGYRRVIQNPKPSSQIVLESPSVRSKVEVSVRVLVADDASNPFTFLIEAVGSSDHLEIRLEDVYPQLTPVLDIQMAGWSRKLLSRLLAASEEQSRTFFKKNQ